MKTRREQIWCEAEFDSYQFMSGTLREVGMDGKNVGTFVVTAHWQARVRGERMMLAISATLPGDDREWRGRFAPNGGAAGWNNRVVIRPHTKPSSSLALTGPAAPPTRLAG